MIPNDETLDDLLAAAISHFRDNRYVASIELFEKYVRYRSDDACAFYFYGECLRIIGKWNESESAFLKVVDFNSKYSGRLIYTRLARLYDDWGKPQLAEEYWQKVCSASDAPGWAWILRGGNLADCGRYEEAEPCFRKALEVGDCDSDEANVGLGYVSRARGNYVDAEIAYQKALELDPSNLEAIAGLQSLKGHVDAGDNVEKLLRD